MNTATSWILLRGLAREARHWGGFAALLQRHLSGAQVHAIDLPGAGTLAHLRSPASVAAIAERCRAQALARRIEPPLHLFGLSLGAMTAVAWAQQHPCEVASLVLVNASAGRLAPLHWRLRPAAGAALLRLLGPGLDARAREARILALTSSRARHPAALLDAWTAYRQERPMAASDALSQLCAAARFRAPPRPPVRRVLVLCGAGDALVDPRCSRRLAAAWGCELAEHPRAGHDLPLDEPGWVALQVRAHLHAGVTAPP